MHLRNSCHLTRKNLRRSRSGNAKSQKGITARRRFWSRNNRGLAFSAATSGRPARWPCPCEPLTCSASVSRTSKGPLLASRDRPSAICHSAKKNGPGQGAIRLVASFRSLAVVMMVVVGMMMVVMMMRGTHRLCAWNCEGNSGDGGQSESKFSHEITPRLVSSVPKRWRKRPLASNRYL